MVMSILMFGVAYAMYIQATQFSPLTPHLPLLFIAVGLIQMGMYLWKLFQNTREG
jgi:hypothetical protein